MRKIKIILLKELRGYFNSPIAYIILVAWFLLTGWFFVSGLLLAKQATIESLLNFAPLLLVLFIPAITMRLLAEEEKIGTAEILTTMPIKDWQIIIAKYLGALILVSIGIISTIIYPITISFIGKIDWGVVISSYIGLILMAASFSAIGIFASAITKSQIVAFIISIFVCFIFFILGKILFVIPSGLVSFFQYLSIDYHLESLTRGVIDSRNIIYFSSLIAFFLCFTFYFYRRIKHRLLSGTTILIILGIIICVNFLSYRIFIRGDLTQGNIYSISKATTKILRSIEDPIIITAYITDKLPFPYNTRSKYIKDIIQEYRMKARGKIKYEWKNPQTQDEKMEAQRAGIFPLQFTEVKEGGEYGIKEGYMGLSILYGDKRETIPVVEDITTLEYDLTSRIKKFIAKGQKTIAFTKGHKEIVLHERILQKLQEQYRIDSINLDSVDIPLDVAVLVILGPRVPYNDTAVQKIKKFMERGGSCGFFIDRVNVNFDMWLGFRLKSGLENLLSEYNINLKEGLVLDMQNQVIGLTMQRGFFTIQNFVPYPFFPKVTNFDKQNPIVRGLESIVLPYTTAIEGGTPIVRSSKRSWFITPDKGYYLVSPTQQYFPLSKEDMGSFDLVCINTNPRFIVTGTAKFVESDFLSPANAAFFLNCIDWLAEDEELIAIRSKGFVDRPIRPLGRGAKIVIRWLNFLLPSIILICLGIFRWKKRETKSYEFYTKG